MRELAAKYWGVAVLVVSALLWLRLHDNNIRAQALSNARRDSLNVAAEIIAEAGKINDSIVLELSLKDSIIEQRKAELSQQEKGMAEILQRATNLTDSAVAQIKLNEEERKVLSDAIANERIQHLARVERLSETILLQEQQIQSRDSIIGLRETEIAQLKTLNAGLQQEVNRLNRQIRPKSGLIEKAAIAVIAYGVGKL